MEHEELAGSLIGGNMEHEELAGSLIRGNMEHEELAGSLIRGNMEHEELAGSLIKGNMEYEELAGSLIRGNMEHEELAGSLIKGNMEHEELAGSLIRGNMEHEELAGSLIKCNMEYEEVAWSLIRGNMELEELALKPGVEETQKNPPDHTESSNAWTPPSGGYGWVIVLGGFLLWFEYASITQSGIFMLRVAPDFNVTKSEFSGLNAVQGSLGPLLDLYIVRSMLAPISFGSIMIQSQALYLNANKGMFLGPLIGYVGLRPVVLVGATLLSIGFIGSSFVNEFLILYLTYGLFASIALGVYFCGGAVAVNQYFIKNTAKPNALAVSGFNIGSFVWPALCAWLCEKYGWRKAFLGEGIIHATIGTICVVLLRPPSHGNTFCKQHDEATEGRKVKTSCKVRMSAIIDFTPWMNPTIAMHIIGMFMLMMGHMANAWYLPVRSELLGIAPQTAAWHVSVLGISLAVATPVFSLVGDVKSVNKGIMMSVANYLAAIFTLGSVAMNSSLEFYIYAVFLGIFQGMYQGVVLSFFAEVCGPTLMVASTGWFGVANGLMPLSLHAIVGRLLDETGDPHCPFYLGGGCQLLGAFIFTWVTWHMHRRKPITLDIQEVTIPEIANNDKAVLGN